MSTIVFQDAVKASSEVKSQNQTSIAVTQQSELTLKVGDYTGHEITVNGKKYTYSNIAKQVFTTANKMALQGAEITATVSGNVIVKVNRIALNNSGTLSKPLTFASKVNLEELVVNANHVIVKNVTVKKRAIITNKVTASLQFDQVFIPRELLIEKAASTQNTYSPSVIFNGSPVRTVIIERNRVNLTSNVKIPQLIISDDVNEMQLNTNIVKAKIEGSANLRLTGTAKIQELLALKPVKITVDLVGSIQHLSLTNSSAQLFINARLMVHRLELPDNSDVTRIVSNYSWANQYIGKVIVGGEIRTVGEVEGVSSIAISSLPTKVNYVTTETRLDVAGLTVLALTNKGVTSVVTNYSISMVDFTKIGKQSVTISYGGKTATFDITISAPKTIPYVAAGTISNLPAGVSYNAGRLTITSYNGTSFTFKDGTQSKKVELVKGVWQITTVK